MYIKLRQEDYDAIAELIAEEEDVCEGYVEYCDIIEVSFSKNVSVEQEDDYRTGTGAWSVNDVKFNLKEVKCGDNEIRYNHDKLEKTIEKMLWMR